MMGTTDGSRHHRSKRSALAAGITLTLLLVAGCDEAGPPVEDNPRSQAESKESSAPEPRQQPATPPPPQPREQPAVQQQTPPAPQPLEQPAAQQQTPPQPQDTTPAEPPPNNHAEELEQRRQEIEEQLTALRNQIDQERREKAIAEYEASMDYFLSQIHWLEAAVLQMESERVAAYADFEREFGVPFVRFRTNCADAPDFFRCVNTSASMPTYELSIEMAETDIRIYKMAIDALIYPY